jgi:hypothetical protein
MTGCSTRTVASPEWGILGNLSTEKNNLYSTYSPLISIHRWNLVIQWPKTSINVSVGMWLNISVMAEISLPLLWIHVPVIDACHIQIDSNQMVLDQVRIEDEVLFSTSDGPYIPWHFFQQANGDYQHGRWFSDDCRHTEGQQFAKEYFLNGICLSTSFLWAGIVSRGIRGDSMRLLSFKSDVRSSVSGKMVAVHHVEARSDQNDSKDKTRLRPQ